MRKEDNDGRLGSLRNVVQKRNDKLTILLERWVINSSNGTKVNFIFKPKNKKSIL